MSGISSPLMAGVVASWAAALAPADTVRAAPAAGEVQAAAQWFDAPDTAAQLLRAPADRHPEAPHALAQRFLGCLLAGDGG